MEDETGAEQTENVDTQEPDTTTEAAQPQAAETVDWEAKYKETLAHSRKHEARAKEHADAAKELAKLKQSQMTEAEKVQAERDQAAKDAADARAELAVERAARKHGISDDKDLELLAGLPADKVDAFAKRISESNKASAAGRSGNPVGGGQPKAKPTTLNGAIGAYYSN